MTNKTTLSLIKDITILLITFLILGYFIFSFWGIFFPFAMSIIIAYLLNPLIGKITVKFGLSRIMAVLLIYIIFFSLIGLGLYIAIPLLIKEVGTIQANLPTYMKYLQESIDVTFTQIHNKFPQLPIKDIDVMGFLTKRADSYALQIFKNIPLFISTVVSLLMIMILVPFVTFFLLKDGPLLKRKLYELIPNQYYELYRNLAYRMDKQLGNYIRGQALDALLCGILSSIGLWIIGVKYFFIIGMFAGLANLIPYFGPVMGMIPAMFVSIMDKGFDPQFILIIFITFTIVQLIDNLVINPVVVGSSVELHPLVVMIAIMLGGQMGGLLAMLLAVPFVSVMKIVIIELNTEIKYRRYLALNKSD